MNKKNLENLESNELLNNKINHEALIVNIFNKMN